MSYNADGQINTTQVNGSSYTGLYAADGSWNIVINSSTSPVGKYHPCGAFNAVVTANASSNAQHPNGSIHVVLNKFGGYSPTHTRGNGRVGP